LFQQFQHSIQDIKEILKDDLALIDIHLKNIVLNQDGLISQVVENIFSGGGKRIRPILHILTGKLLQSEPTSLDESFYYLAAAIELIHCATLLHDDVIDKSDLRRGKKTANYLFDNKTAILVGDFLFAESFKLMVKTNNNKALNVLATTSSLISQGEVRQLELQQKDFITKDQYYNVIEAKTAILFAASTELSAYVSAENQCHAAILKDFGLNLGLAFQIIDDILDYNSASNLLGKEIGDDFFEQKITLPIILLEKKLDSQERLYLKQLFDKKYQPNNKDLLEITKLLNKYDIFNQSFSYAERHVNSALEILNSFAKNEARDILESICRIIIARKY
jgi:octaprenyl-diphosphate synthase